MAQPHGPSEAEKMRLREEVRSTLLKLSNTTFANRADTISFQDTYRNIYIMCMRNQGLELLYIFQAVFEDAAVKYVWQQEKYATFITKVSDLCVYWDNVEAVKHNVFKVRDLALQIWDQRPIVWARLRRLLRLIGLIARLWRVVTVHNNEKKYAPGGLHYKQVESNFNAFCELEKLGKTRE